jgi:hypothetical protein
VKVFRQNIWNIFRRLTTFLIKKTGIKTPNTKASFFPKILIHSFLLKTDVTLYPTRVLKVGSWESQIRLRENLVGEFDGRCDLIFSIEVYKIIPQEVNKPAKNSNCVIYNFVYIAITSYKFLQILSQNFGFYVLLSRNFTFYKFYQTGHWYLVLKIIKCLVKLLSPHVPFLGEWSRNTLRAPWNAHRNIKNCLSLTISVILSQCRLIFAFLWRNRRTRA